MYRSLENVCNDNFKLYIFAFNKKAEVILKKLNLPNAVIISLEEFEDPKLILVKSGRTAAEYCWTATSSTILYVLEKFNEPVCTYLDADLYFYSNPGVLLDEMGENSILITEHRYSPQYNKEVKSGKYCVQFVTFFNNEKGLKALRWWRDRCLEWCYDRYEDGKFGDQLYLDDWTERFEGVHVLKHLGGGLAAWNVQQYSFSVNENMKITGKEITSGNTFDVIFYHYHYFRFFRNGKIELGRRVLTTEVLNIFYKPYLRALEKAKNEIFKIENDFDPHGARPQIKSIKSFLIYVYRKLNGVWNIFPIKDFMDS
ncbi:MAG: glycosyl transferase [Ignavibacteriaceae bacterium]|nr:glycosyl transferase [Ignavibacteriaceae bacterium]